MDAWEFLISLTNIGTLRVRVSTADVGYIGVGRFITDFWRIGAQTPPAGVWSGSKAPTAWHIIVTKGPSPLVTETSVQKMQKYKG